MNNRPRRFLTSFLIACLLAAVNPGYTFTALAGSAKISFSDPKATVGEEFAVSVKITASEGQLGAADVMLSYDPAYIEFVSGNNANGGAGAIRLIGTMDSEATTVFSYNLRFKALQAGDAAISVASYEVYDKDTQAVDVTKVGASAIKVTAPSTYSSEAALSSLKVSPGTLNPAFSPDVTSYTVNVGADVADILVNAPSKDEKAKVIVSGNSGLKTGANTVVCKVIAEDGKTVRSYKLTVNRAAPGETAADTQAGETAAETQGAVVGELKANIDKKEYSVASSFDPALLPEGYAQGTCSYAGNEIMCGSGNGLTLIYLQDSEGNGGFYIYSENSGALSPYVSIDVSAKSIIVLPIDDTVEVPEGLVETVIKLNGTYEVHGFVWQSAEEVDYCVIYGMNEKGEKGLYQYDDGEKTFQRYFEDPEIKSQYDDVQVEELLNKYNSLCKDYNLRFIIIVGLIIVSLLLFFMVINLLLRKRERDYEESCIEEARNSKRGGRQGREPGDYQAFAFDDREKRGSQKSGRYESDARGAGQRGLRSGGGRKEPAAGRELDPMTVTHGRMPENTRKYQEEAAAARQPRYVREDGKLSPELQSGYEAERAQKAGPSARANEEFGNHRPPRQADREELHERPYRQPRQGFDEGLRESERQRQLLREERARMARERLERERREDERRSRLEASSRRRQEEDDDFEFLDLD